MLMHISIHQKGEGETTIVLLSMWDADMHRHDGFCDTSSLLSC